MKLKKINTKNYSLLTLKLIDFKTFLGLKKLAFYYLNFKYVKGFRNNFSIFELYFTKIFLKKSLKIIYKYHNLNKKILFVGFNDIKNYTNFKFLLKQTKHFYYNLNFWIYSFLTTRNQVFQHLKKKLFNYNKKNFSANYFILQSLFHVQKTPDLIVFLDSSQISNAQKEIESSNIPLILFCNNDFRINYPVYKIPGRFNVTVSKLFLFLLFKSVLTFSIYNGKKAFLL